MHSRARRRPSQPSRALGPSGPISASSSTSSRGKELDLGEALVEQRGEHNQRDDNGDSEDLSEVVMAVNLTDRGTVGCAYYVARTETLYFMEEMRMGNAEVVDACKSLYPKYRLNADVRSENVH